MPRISLRISHISIHRCKYFLVKIMDWCFVCTPRIRIMCVSLFNGGLSISGNRTSSSRTNGTWIHMTGSDSNLIWDTNKEFDWIGGKTQRKRKLLRSLGNVCCHECNISIETGSKTTDMPTVSSTDLRRCFTCQSIDFRCVHVYFPRE
jgi:hypothetical protein